MTSIVDLLEGRLIQDLTEQETKKNWEEWIDLLSVIDCPISFEKPLNLKNSRFNFQTLISLCEQQLIKFPDWQTRFSSPSWLIRQKIFVIPRILKKFENQVLHIEEIGGLNLELTRLIDQIHNVQKIITNLETGTSNIKSKDFSSGMNLSTSEFKTPTSGLSDSLGRPDLARTIERELQLKNKVNSSVNLTKVKEGLETNEPQIVPLKEAYLSFNNWCDQFDEVHLDLQQFVEGDLRVTGSHEISYQQFCHRILKKALEVKELQNVLETFSRLRSGGVDKNL